MEALIILLRNLITPIFVSVDKFLLSLSRKSKVFHLLGHLLLSFFSLLFHLLLSRQFSFSSCGYITADHDLIAADQHRHKSAVPTARESSAIGRALEHLLSLIGEIPVSSRKYDVVRSLGEKCIHENLKEDSSALRDVNCTVLLAAFSRTLSQLEATIFDGGSTKWLGFGPSLGENGLGRAVRTVRDLYVAASSGGGANAGGSSPEKMAAELVWLAEKLDESGGVMAAVDKWASASGLGWAALTAEARVQAYLVKLTAFLIKQLKEKDIKQEIGGGQKQTKLKLLMTWLPLLCRASTGAEAPTLSSSEREEIERALEGIIDMLEEEENQEKVLSLWLYHFTHCPSSDWPNLYGSYTRWCNTSRRLLLTR